MPRLWNCLVERNFFAAMGNLGETLFLIYFAGQDRSPRRSQFVGTKRRILVKSNDSTSGLASPRRISQFLTLFRGSANASHPVAVAITACITAAIPRTAAIFRAYGRWIREDLEDFRNMSQLAAAAARRIPAASASHTQSAWRQVAGRFQRTIAAIRTILGATISIARLACLGGVIVFCAIVLTLDVFLCAVRPRIRPMLRRCATWLLDDWRDIANCTRYCLIAISRRSNAVISFVFAPVRLLTSLVCATAGKLGENIAAVNSWIPFTLTFGLAWVRNLRLAFGDVVTGTRSPAYAVAVRPATTRASPLNRRPRYRFGATRPACPQQQLRRPARRVNSIGCGLAHRWARFRYWRYRTYRFIHSYATDTSAQEHALNICVFLFGILIAGGGQVAIQFYSENRAQTDFERPGKEVIVFLTETIDRHVAALESAQRGFTAKKTVPNRWKFFQSTRESLKDLPGIQAVEWVPRVRTKYRKRYEKRAIKDGLFGFQFFGPNGAAAQAENGEHFPVYYVEPYPGNEGALGFDLANDPAALKALRQARDTGKPVTATPMAIDVGNSKADRTGTAPAVVVVLPVYNTEVLPFTTQERRRHITGFIRGVIRLDRMIQAYRSNLSVPPGLEVAFYDHERAGKARLRYQNPPVPANARPLPYPNAAKSDDINMTASFNIVDQHWSMVLRPESRLFLRNLSSASWAFAIFALLTTAILLLYLVTSQTRTRMIERSVTERTIELEAEIAQRKRIEAELRAAKDEAVDANHAKSEFLAIMSHELRTPLNAISGFSEVMSNEVYGVLGHKNYGDYASFIYDSANHLLSLINDILDLSKIEAERYEIEKEEIHLADVWRPVEEMLGEQIASAKVTLDDRISHSPVRIRADERALRQIFLNLLSNAVKFTPEDGRIETRADVDDAGRLIISVSDTGIGISKEDLDLVFEPFKQVESKVARKHKGTGLGLPLTQRLVELHGGHMEIESALGEGTTIRIVLESDAVIHEDDLDYIGERTERGRFGATSTESAPAAKIKAVGNAVDWEIQHYAKG